MISSLRLQTKKANLAKMQPIRIVVQIVFLALLIAGVYFKLRSVLTFLLPLSFIAGNYFCGWICPYGTAQDIFGKIGSLFWKKKFKMPPQIQRYAQYSRYLLMAAFLLLGVRELPINAYKSFMSIATGRTVEAIALLIVGCFLVIALFFERPFCNYFCLEGIKYGAASLTRFFTIKRNQETCVNCKQCDKACPMNIQLSTGKDVRNAQCINCFKCIAACPVNNTLTYGKAAFNCNYKKVPQN